MNKKKVYSLISFVLWLALAFGWLVLIILNFIQGNVSAGKTVMYVLFLISASICSVRGYKDYIRYR